MRQVTVANYYGHLASGWIPATAAAAVNDLVDIAGEAFTVLAIYPAVETPDNRLPVWPAAKRWDDLIDDTLLRGRRAN